MDELIKKYEQKLIKAGLGEQDGPHAPLIGGLDDELIWNRNTPLNPVLKILFDHLNINSIVCQAPSEPYRSLLMYLAGDALHNKNRITPKDCETRTFLHDLPVIRGFHPLRAADALKKRKCVIILPDENEANGHPPTIIAHGTVSPEQGFVTISSVCFACFVKFFTDFLTCLRMNTCPESMLEVFNLVRPMIDEISPVMPRFIPSPYRSEQTVYDAVAQAGKFLVDYGLVDSYFGNVSYLYDNTLYISQTGSSLDELEGCIDPVPMDGSSSAGLTASSELSAHMETIRLTGAKAILHGHPKFSVILSMDCDPEEKAGCAFSDQCHIKCPKKRFFKTTPIVPGEVGTGPTGLCNTLPPALHGSDTAIVYGHGLFTIGKKDFSQAFASMLQVEADCRKAYFDLVDRLLLNAEVLS